jgi:hypothetical protein
MKKIVAVVLLVAGIGLCALSAYVYFFSEDFVECQRATAEAERRLNEARAAQGTPREAAAVSEARSAVESQTFWCRHARDTRQWMILMGVGGLALIIVSVVLLVIWRKRAA